MTPTPIDLAAQALREAQAQEDAARMLRLKAEEELMALVGCKDEGQATTKTAWFRIVSEGRINRTLDPLSIEDIRASIPPELFEKVIRYKPELIRSGLSVVPTPIRKLFEAAITERPGKPSVRVELLEQEQ